MPTHRFPVLLCRDAAGLRTAVLADADDPLAAFSATGPDALEQLRDYLHWAWKQSAGAPPDFLEPQLTTFRVEVRPEYRDGKRVFPCEYAFTLRVPCVHGKQESG